MKKSLLPKKYSLWGNARTTLPDFALGALLGVAVFILIYGISTLNVTYDSWIYCGYIEEDIIQSYGGWLYLRQAPWAWPLTVAQNLSVPLGASIAFTDSIPLVAILCKVFAPLLPQTFQYFGWYNLFNFALQGGFAVLLLRHFKLGRVYSLLGSLLFTTAPIFLERAFRHSGLGSQWLLLAALWLYFKSRPKGAVFPLLGFTVLCTLAVGIHTYFLPMIYAIFFAALLYQVLTKKKFWRYALYLAGSFVPVLGMAYITGILTRGGGGSASGFGSYSLNLNALVNPTSFDWYAQSRQMAWSRFLPVLPQGSHQYDAFNYAGAGILLALGGMALVGLVRLVQALRHKEYSGLCRAWATLKSHAGLVFVCVCLTLFGISNVVTLGSSTLFTVPLPAPILIFCGIFRSSGRLIWPCNYLLTLGVVVFIGRRFTPNWRMVVLGVIVLVQLADISGAVQKKHDYFAGGPLVEQTEYSTPGWKFMAENYDNVYYLGNIFDYKLTAGFIRYNPKVQTNAILTNRGNFAAVTEQYSKLMEQLKSGAPLPGNTLYVCSDAETFNDIMQSINPQARGYQAGEFYLIANPLPACPLPEVVPAA